MTNDQRMKLSAIQQQVQALGSEMSEDARGKRAMSENDRQRLLVEIGGLEAARAVLETIG